MTRRGQICAALTCQSFSATATDCETRVISGPETQRKSLLVSSGITAKSNLRPADHPASAVAFSGVHASVFCTSQVIAATVCGSRKSTLFSACQIATV